eukprot:gene13431-9242_t
MSAEALRKLREERQRAYSRLQCDQRPHVETCRDCRKPAFYARVCPATGVLHELENKKVVGGMLVDRECTVLRGAQLMEAIDNGQVRWQPSRTQLVKADISVVHIFQSFGFTTGWSLHRYGILYGKYDKAAKQVEIHAIYEPQQLGNGFTFEALKTDTPKGFTSFEEERRVNLLAQGLGLRRVGVICSHPPRASNDTFLSSRELLLCAKEQSIYGDECVLLTVSPSVDDDDDDEESTAKSSSSKKDPSFYNSPTSTRAGATCRCEAWQASEQCVRLFQMGMLMESPAFESAPTDREAIRFVVSPRLALTITEEKRDQDGKLSFQALEPSKRVDTHWFTSYIAVEKFESDVVSNVFMRRHRAGLSDPTPQNLRQYWNDPKRQQDAFIKRVADFQVLLYLMVALGPERMIGTDALRSGEIHSARTLSGAEVGGAEVGAAAQIGVKHAGDGSAAQASPAQRGQRCEALKRRLTDCSTAIRMAKTWMVEWERKSASGVDTSLDTRCSRPSRLEQRRPIAFAGDDTQYEKHTATTPPHHPKKKKKK